MRYGALASLAVRAARSASGLVRLKVLCRYVLVHYDPNLYLLAVRAYCFSSVLVVV